MDLSFLLSPIAGAVIGYFTNWLAIKMLFLPRSEKYFMGKRLPFTPGLIPKERYKLSQKVGGVAGEYILTEETIRKYIDNDKNKENIVKFINNNIEQLEHKDFNIEQFINLILKDKSNDFIDNVFDILSNEIQNIIENDNTKEFVVNTLTVNIIDFVKNYNDFIDKEKVFDYLKNVLTENAEIFIDNNVLKNIAFDKLKDKTIGDFINSNLEEKLKNLIKEKLPIILNNIMDKIEQNNIAEKKIKEMIKAIINEHVGSFVSVFISSDKIYNSMKKGIRKYINDEENKDDINKYIFDFIEKYKENKVIYLIENIPNEVKQNINGLMSKDNIVLLIDKFCLYLKQKNDFNIYDVIFKIQPNIDDELKNCINNIWQNNLKDKLKIKATELVDYIKLKLLNFKVNNIIDFIIKDKVEFNSFIKKRIDIIINKLMNYFFNEISIANIIEEKINSFDVKIIEDIITSVAKKELNAITYVGGVLGFFIGFIPMLLNKLI